MLGLLHTSVIILYNEKELRQIKRHMGHSADCFSKAFRVKNSNRDNAFWNYYDKHNYHKEDIHYWYHGSRNMNCLSILHNGLILNPKAPKVGHMFGYGIYLAPKAKKSIGYTSLNGSFWVHGTSDKAYLFVMKTVYKSPYHVYTWTITPGMAQPVPMTKGITDLPERPTFLKMGSSTTETRDI